MAGATSLIPVAIFVRQVPAEVYAETGNASDVPITTFKTNTGGVDQGAFQKYHEDSGG